MRTQIFYFSGTGNSLKVARDLAKELGGAEIINIAKIIDEEVILTADRIGIVFPVYIWGPPLMVADFIKKLKPAKKKYFFAVATCGGMAGGAVKHVEKLLAGRGIELSSGFVLTMPDNYIPWFDVTSEGKQKLLFENEAAKVKEIAAVVGPCGKNHPEESFFLISFIGSIVNRLASGRMKTLDKNFWADKTCNGCGTCAKICPAGNIEMVDKHPVWMHKCQQCFACLHWCPKEAIQYGKKTVGKKRYRNPFVNPKDLTVYDSFDY